MLNKFAPASASLNAMAKPMPLDPPVTKAVLFSKSIFEKYFLPNPAAEREDW
jgi:hypothetical protein